MENDREHTNEIRLKKATMLALNLIRDIFEAHSHLFMLEELQYDVPEIFKIDLLVIGRGCWHGRLR